MEMNYGKNPNATARVSRRPRSNEPFRRGGATNSFRPAFHARASRKSLSQEGRRESKQTRTQTKDHSFGLGPAFQRVPA
jgi:hypothetical protein